MPERVREPEARAFERRETDLERLARRVAAARVDEAAIRADRVLREGHRLVDRHDGGAGRGVGRLPGVDRERLELHGPRIHQ